MNFWQAIENRRTYYSITNVSPISDERIETIVNDAVKHAPSAFNSQSARAVVLFGENHGKLWQIVKDNLQPLLSAERFTESEQKIDNCFASGYASILFFEDQAVIKGLQQQFPSYKEAFPLFSYQSAGMLQYIIWSALEAEGLGASLQHYNPLIDNAVKAEWQLPAEWQLLAQMPFGKPSESAGEKAFSPLADRIKVFR